MAKRRRKKKKILARVIITTVFSIVLFIVLLLLLFHVREIDVQGTVYSSKQEVMKWLQKDKSTANGIYVWWKCEYSDETKPPAIDKMDVKFKMPWSISIKVTEKKPIGYIDYKNEYLYFTQGGIAIYKTDQKIEKVSYIEGMELKESKVKMGKVIPVSDEKVFQRIMDISELLAKLKLKPDRIVCNGSGLNIYFAGVEVLLGKNDYDAKLAQLPPILKILNEKYPGIKGTLYLEHFEKIEKGIRFVPEKDEPEPEKDESPSESDSDNSEGMVDGTEQMQDTDVIEYTPENEEYQQQDEEESYTDNEEF